MKYLLVIAILLSGIGLADATFLTYEHFTNSIPPCTSNPLFSDCGTVLRSQYATVFGVPLAFVGIVYYATILVSLLSTNRYARFLALLVPIGGFVSSLYFMYLQIFVIHALCIFCFISAITTTLLLLTTQLLLSKERKVTAIYLSQKIYGYLIKPVLFTIDPEMVHNCMTKIGSLLGSFFVTRMIISFLFQYRNPSLEQTIANMHFANPIGLAAGFDYEAKLTQVLPQLGFGFETIGTITNHPYGGNRRPRLGRLPQSKSLMVNKGFKNLGVKKTVRKLSKLNFEFPLGVSIGRTNNAKIQTQKQALEDIIEAFSALEKSIAEHSYYELNISCPNLYGEVSFYPEKNLDELLTEVDKLQLSRPLFIKMPIEKSDKEVLAMLKIISEHSPNGVIFGNLQKDRSNPNLVQSEVAKFPVGNFSGKPTFNRSNELIKLAYKHFGDKFIIIGCGGVFNAQDAYKKIQLGASLVQLITGMVFQGPQLIPQINIELVDLLKKEKFNHISEAVGSKNR